MGEVRPARPFRAAREHLQKFDLLTSIKPRRRFFGLHLNLNGKVDVRGRDDLFFGLHLNLSGKLDIRGHAALGFKIFSNAALRVNIIAHPCFRHIKVTCYATEILEREPLSHHRRVC